MKVYCRSNGGISVPADDGIELVAELVKEITASAIVAAEDEYTGTNYAREIVISSHWNLITLRLSAEKREELEIKAEAA